LVLQQWPDAKHNFYSRLILIFLPIFAHAFRHKIIIITAPSGAGKTSITKHLLKTFPDKLAFSISAATRQQRSYEKNGVDYHFMSVDDFKEKIQSNSFVEWENGLRRKILWHIEIRDPSHLERRKSAFTRY
jgi:predicted ATP-binding protein involved in virulence